MRTYGRIDRIWLCKETKSYFDEILQHVGDKLVRGIKGTKLYIGTSRISKKANRPIYQTVYRVIKGDTIDVAIKLKRNEGLNSLVLNLASAARPGGGWENGAMAQEEALFYRSTYDMSLSDVRRIDSSRHWRYPIPVTGGIYSPDVFVFRGNEKEGYPVWDYRDCIFLDFVAVAALRHPQLTENGHLSKQDSEITRDKIRTILRIAHYTGHKDVLLGALGCGAYKNPPEDIATLFVEILSDEEFKGVFRHVDFAILDNPHRQEGNYGIFKKFIDILSTKQSAMAFVK